MPWVASGLVLLVAALHAAFMVLEMFLWTEPYAAVRLLGESHDVANSRVLAQNQGLSNGFLAAGLLWSVAAGPRGRSVRVFCLLCAVVAGVFGAVTTARPTFLAVQTAPAVLALAVGWLADRRRAGA